MLVLEGREDLSLWMLREVFTMVTVEPYFRSNCLPSAMKGLRWPAAVKGNMTMFLSSLPLAMATMRVETGNGKLRRSRELWWGLEMHCPIYLQSAYEKTHKHCFRAKRNGTPINAGHLIQGLIN